MSIFEIDYEAQFARIIEVRLELIDEQMLHRVNISEHSCGGHQLTVELFEKNFTGINVNLAYTCVKIEPTERLPYLKIGDNSKPSFLASSHTWDVEGKIGKTYYFAFLCKL